jgi:Xaa-Pro aminopeptidase
VNKLKKLRNLFKIHNLDGYIVPKNDEFFGEYVERRTDRLNFISSFSGSVGQALILKRKAYLFVDGRYTLQAKKEVNKSFSIIEIHKTKPSKILEKIDQKLKIGFDPKLYSEANLVNNFQTKNTVLFPIEKNLIDRIWAQKPVVKINKFFMLNSKNVGKNYKSKINIVCKILKKRKISKLFITAPENLAWILNIRGKDSKYSPLPNCYAIISDKKKITLVVNKKKIDKKFKFHFKNNLNYIDTSEIIKYFDSLNNNEVFLVDKYSCSFFYKKEIAKRFQFKEKIDPIYFLKAKKNKIEINK